MVEVKSSDLSSRIYISFGEKKDVSFHTGDFQCNRPPVVPSGLRWGPTWAPHLNPINSQRNQNIVLVETCLGNPRSITSSEMEDPTLNVLILNLEISQFLNL